jgi:predicted transporter
MMETTSNFAMFGIIIGILILLAFKTGLGCGFASLKQREIIYFATLYLIASVVMGYLVGITALNLTQNILAAGVAMHVIIAAGLIYFGIRTKKEWHYRQCDISRKTFLWLSVPCPACLAALFLVCAALASSTDRSSILIGGVVGATFFIGVCVSAFSISSIAKNLNCKNPSALGMTMLLIGMFYLLSTLMIPAAYIQEQALTVPTHFTNFYEILLALVFMTGLGIVGVIKDRYNRSKY